MATDPGNNQQLTVPARPTCALAVAVFAHNEEASIEVCLRQITQGIANMDARVYVLANGCRDRTATLARQFSARDPRFSVVEIALADKANAWNTYVHDQAPLCPVHIFLDGDISPTRRSFAAVTEAFSANLYANAMAGLPAGGRNAARWRAHILKNHSMPGGFYALRGSFLERLRARNARLPIGLIGDDILVPLFVRTDIGRQGVLDRARIASCETATFTYEPLSYLRIRDIRLYVRRRLRYSLRHFQNQLLIPRVRALGVDGVPTAIDALYSHQTVSTLRPRLGPFATPFDLWAIARIRTWMWRGGHDPRPVVPQSGAAD